MFDVQGVVSPSRRRQVAVVAAFVMGAPLAMGATAVADAQKTGDPGRSGSAPGHTKAEGAPAQPTPPVANGRAGKPAKPARPAKPAKPAKPRKAAKPAKPVRGKAAPKPAKPAKPVRAKSAPEPSRQPKVTICHATGSATNPYVEITVAAPAVRAHSRHQDGRDIVPAPAGGCPGGTAPEAPAAAGERTAKGKDKRKVTICHATGSATNPYVKITIAQPAVEAHRRHQDGRDIIPAPAGDCPATATAPAAAEGTTGIRARGFPAPLAAFGIGPAAPATPAVPAAPGTAAVPATPAVPAASGVLGEQAESAGTENGAAAVRSATAGRDETTTATTRRESGAGVDSGSLPFTGLTLAFVIAAGLASLLAGFALRRVSRPTA